MKLTGRFRFRLGFTGSVILEVEEGGYGMWEYARAVRYGTRWRRASWDDLIDPAMSDLFKLMNVGAG